MRDLWTNKIEVVMKLKSYVLFYVVFMGQFLLIQFCAFDFCCFLFIIFKQHKLNYLPEEGILYQSNTHSIFKYLQVPNIIFPQNINLEVLSIL